ncbi:sensor histidine kinase [Flavisolibacter ginsenosidimutans]|uniref:histidine kinase n=1 Tax=Flavisolibacter ginsenosidimutans TaxID=661481 RepID=A0A5B8UMP6_9BACT|nr:HAMP domain-containing sensor histidine kinase [Flavisolibacter ginsenosidimutans]QEC57904.1 HAMP domain-containing histidine kinase [Flavisolibacter ginsenosidimutans]
MIAKTSYTAILFRSILLFVTLAATSFFLVKAWYLWAALIAPFLIYQMIEFFRFQKKTHEEVNQFLEAIHYRDFSRQFDVKHASADIQPLRQGFNEINTTFKVISKEKETQYQYLQKILELVDTGILSYEVESGEVIWMNETLKRLLELPYLRTIHSLQKRNEALFTELQAIRPSETRIVTVHLEKSTFKALLSASAFQINGKGSKLIAFQNVNEALDETESKAWQKLLSVMTHEIMNSVAPISSLAETLKNRLQLASTQLEDDAVEDLELGIDTIKRRSEGLLKFAETYRSLNKITTLNLKKIYVRELFAHLHQLMQPTFEQKGVELEIILKNTDLQMMADPSLLEQVFINLIVNALEAVKEAAQPKIILSAGQLLDKKIILKVGDNGSGMADEVVDKIFIPFFSTKKTGSGIGLSLCKQIVMLHKGTIQVQSKQGQGTVFVMQFS